ncbi:MAG TPA: SagB/ThcOx family dehydrogenase [Polyangiaceae bacterium]
MQSKRGLERAFGLAMLVSTSAALSCGTSAGAPAESPGDHVGLPAPRHSGPVSLEEAIARRRSIRQFSSRVPDDEQIGQLLWAAQGVTDPARGLRAAPSAGALYPLDLYVARSDGVYQYEPQGHVLRRVADRDEREALGQATLSQEVVLQAPVVIAVVGVVSRTATKYGARAGRFVDLEAGHATENLLLEATALGLAAVPIGAFDDGGVRAALGVPSNVTPLYVVPVGFEASAMPSEGSRTR